MTIPAEFTAKYANEDQFVDQFLIPLLRRMGFSVVVNYHGKQEFGKDLIFAEISQFGHVVYHGLQAKYVDSIGQSESHGLVEDCNEAFGNPFRHPQTGAEERISSFYAVNGGSIADNARTHFFNSLQAPHGGHIRLLDGKALLALDRSATIRRMEDVGPLLHGLRLECAHNYAFSIVMLEKALRRLSDPLQPIPGERFRTLALGNYLVRPLSMDELSDGVVIGAWSRCQRVNGWLDHVAGISTSDTRKEVMQAVVDQVPVIQDNMRTILAGIEKIIASLGPLVSV